MSGSARRIDVGLRGVLLCLVVALCSLRSTPARADPVPDPDADAAAPTAPTRGNQPKIDAIWVDVPREIGLVCSEPLAEPVKKALGCGCDKEGRTCWKNKEVLRKGAAKAPLVAFRPSPPAQGEICEAIALLNDPDPKVTISEPARRLIRLCGYRENPARKVQSACEEARSASLAMAKQAAEYREKLGCTLAPRDARDSDLPAWDGDPGKLPICADALRYSKGLEGLQAVTELSSLCGKGSQRSAVLPIAAMVAAPLVQGLGDFLSARAREELTTFATEQIGRRFCMPTADKLNGQTLFHDTCAAMFPKGPGEEADRDFIASGRLQRVLVGELRALPVRLLTLEVVQSTSDVETRQIKIILTDLMNELEKARASESNVLDFFAALEAQIREDLKKQSLTPTCAFVAGKQAPVPCAMMLFFTVAAKAKDVSPTGRDPGPRDATINGDAWIKASASAFCESYGGGAATGATCLFGGFSAIDADFFQGLHDVAQAAVEFHNDIGVIQVRSRAARTDQRLSLDVAVEVATGTASALRQLTAAIVSFSQKLLAKADPSAALADRARLVELKQTVELIDDMLQAVSGVMKNDVREVAASLRMLFASPRLTARMSPAFKQGLRFMFDMVEAKTRDEVRKVLEDNAAPLGSYKAKYEATTLRVTLNGLVGLFGGMQVPLVARSNRAGYKAPSVAFFQPLSAPVGIDLSAPAFGGQHHLGATFTLIDPLALRLTEAADKTTQADFDGVLTPGALLRWGIFRSPVLFMIGVRLQPLVRSQELTCGAAGNETPCWQGVVSGMAGFAVDLPLVPLN